MIFQENTQNIVVTLFLKCSKVSSKKWKFYNNNKGSNVQLFHFHTAYIVYYTGLKKETVNIDINLIPTYYISRFMLIVPELGKTYSID